MTVTPQDAIDAGEYWADMWIAGDADPNGFARALDYFRSASYPYVMLNAMADRIARLDKPIKRPVRQLTDAAALEVCLDCHERLDTLKEAP